MPARYVAWGAILGALAGAVVRDCSQNVVLSLNQNLTAALIRVEAYNLNGTDLRAESRAGEALAVLDQRPAGVGRCDQYLQGFQPRAPDPNRPNCLDLVDGFAVCAGQRGLDENDAVLAYDGVCHTADLAYVRVEVGERGLARRVLALYQDADAYRRSKEFADGSLTDSVRLLLDRRTCNPAIGPSPSAPSPTTAPNTPTPSVTYPTLSPSPSSTAAPALTSAPNASAPSVTYPTLAPSSPNSTVAPPTSSAKPSLQPTASPSVTPCPPTTAPRSPTASPLPSPWLQNYSGGIDDVPSSTTSLRVTVTVCLSALISLMMIGSGM